MVKNSSANAGDTGDVGLIPGSGRSPGEGNGSPLQYSGKFCGQRSLVGYSPWSCRESDSTEQLSIAQNLDFDITEIAIFFLPGKPHGQRCWFQNSWT